MAERILEVEALSKRFGGFVALDAVSLHLDEGERLGLIGPNGSGKTTMINCISGALPCDGGTVVFKGQDVTRLPAYRRVRLGITRSFQIPRPFRRLFENPSADASPDFGTPTAAPDRGPPPSEAPRRMIAPDQRAPDR